MLPKYPIKAQNATNTESTDVAVFIVPDGAISGNEVDISGSSDPLVYRALLTQTGTDAPIATVLENTLGGTVTWTSNSTGLYRGITDGLFTGGQTCLPPVNASMDLDAASTFVETSFYRVNADQVNLQTALVSPGDDTIILTDALLTSTYVEILVYP